MADPADLEAACLDLLGVSLDRKKHFYLLEYAICDGALEALGADAGVMRSERDF